MSEEAFDVIIVGGGLAGCVSAYVCASAGLETLLIERGNFAGAKNMTGGRLYAHSLEHIFPDFASQAPVERCITHEKVSFMTEGDSFTLDSHLQPQSDPAARSYSVLRAQFDQWLATKAEEAGANIVTGIRVDDLLMDNGKVCGVIAGEEEMPGNMVILADGVNSLLGEKLGMVTKVTPPHCAVGVKEVIQLGQEQINDRFGCTDEGGTAWLFAGSPSNGHMGGGFLYTNKESVSLGLVFGLHNIEQAQKSVPQMLEDFKHHPTVAPLIRGGTTVEYSAHVVPEGGLDMLPQLVGSGVVIAGDAAGLCLNVGYTVRGMDLAIASGEAAAKAAIAAKQSGDFSQKGLALYEETLRNSFVFNDLKLYQKLPTFLDNPRFFQDYPNMIVDIMRDMFTVHGPSAPLRKKIIPHTRKAGWLNLLKDGFKGATSL